MKTQTRIGTMVLILALVFWAGFAEAQIVTTDLKIHYRADNVDGSGTPGNGSTVTLVNLATPGTHNGSIVAGSGVVQNVPQIGTPYEYGITLTSASETHIQANTFRVQGGVNKVTAATWEFWLRADSGSGNNGMLYSEFPAGVINQPRHFLRLQGIGTTSRTALYDEYPPGGNSVASDSPLFDTSTFTQIVVTKSGDTLTFYKNGVQVGTTKTNGETWEGGIIEQTLFGKRNSGNESFSGQFCIIRVYDAVLNSAQVLANYDAEVVSSTAPAITEGDSTAVTMAEDGSPTAFSLTLNATDPTGQTLTWSIQTQGAHGTASASGTGTSKAIGYTPVADYNGNDSFVVKVTDTDLETDTITVNVTITPQPDAPTVTGSPGVTMFRNGVHTFAAGEFNFFDVDGDSLGKVKVTSLETAGDLEYDSGTWNDVTLNQEISAADIGGGKLRFTPAVGAVGSPYATFGFTVFDDDAPPLASAPATMTIEVAEATLVETGLSIHYRADNVDGSGTPGLGSTVTLVNLATPGTHDGSIVAGAGVVQNVPQIGTPYEYGIPLTGASQTHIQANTFRVQGGVNKVTAATWEFWLRADSGSSGNGALYGEFPAGTLAESRHYMKLEGIGSGSRIARYDEYPFSGGSETSDPQLFDTSTFAQIAVTKNGDTLTFYKNGVQVGATKTQSETFNGGTIAQTLFGKRNSQNDSFSGQFCIIRVYDAVLTPAQVLQNYSAEPLSFVSATAPAITEGDSTAVTMAEDGSPTAFSLTLNATDPTGQTLTWSIQTQGAHGTASASGTGTSKAIGYTPVADYNGNDSFVVKVTDTDLETDTITVNVTITPQPDAPTVTGSPGVTMFRNGVHTFAAGEFNFFDVDGDSLGKVKVTSLETAGDLEYDSGTWNDVTLNQEISAADIGGGKLRFTPAVGAVGSPYATFGFTVFDDDAPPLASAPATMTIEVAEATLVETGLSIHYRADNVDGSGTPGLGSTVTLVNLATPGTHDGSIVAGAGVVQNVPQIGTPYEYGIPLTSASQTHIQANTFKVQGGVNKVTAATWEFWLRADSSSGGNGALYGEFPAGTVDDSRHYMRLDGIGTTSRFARYDEFPPSDNSATSDTQLFETSTFAQIAVTKNGDTLTFYKNGVQVGAAKTQSETYTGSTIAQTLFGKRISANESFSGQFCIIRVYDAVLTPAQILQNYSAETVVVFDGTIFRFR